MRLLVCGSRTYGVVGIRGSEAEFTRNTENRYMLWTVLDQVVAPGHHTLLCGMARGADTWARSHAIQKGWDVEEFPANWPEHGKAAGPIRNQAMLAALPDLVVAFVDKPRARARSTW